MTSATLTHGDRESWVNTIWEALHCHRENNIPEGKGANDEQWDEICTAMAWIREELGLPDETEAQADV
jgi:hypothetical protein